MPLPPAIIERPLQRLGVRTPDEYRANQRRILALNRRAAPHKVHCDPWETEEAILAHVGASAWRVRCVCGEAPPADPEWRLACCSACGAVYVNVVFPVDWRALEVVLLKRRKFMDRNWRHPWTVEDLRQQNTDHGEPA
jgi:hypothetical protein